MSLKYVLIFCSACFMTCVSSYADDSDVPVLSLDDIKPMNLPEESVVKSAPEKEVQQENQINSEISKKEKESREINVSTISEIDPSETSASSKSKSSANTNDFLSNYIQLDGKVLSPSAVATKDGYGVTLSADFIYWYAKQEGLAFASTGLVSNAATLASNTTLPQGQRYYPDFGVSPGFKAAIGYQMDYDSWDLNLNYTWLQSKADRSMTTKESFLGAPLWEIRSQIELSLNAAPENVFNQAASLSSSKANWILHFNVLNFELGRCFFLSPKITLRPHVGLKTSWQMQRYNVNYTGLGVVNTLALIDAHSAEELYKIRSKQSYWGLGLRCGLGSSWQFSRNWSLFGEAALSPMWGQFSERRKDNVNISDVSVEGVTLPLITAFETLNIKRRTHSINPVLEMMMGFRYDVWFAKENARFRLEIGWEEQYWLNHNAFSFSSSDDMLGSLIFQGLTVKARFDF